MFVPDTVRQARWLIAGGVVVFVMGVVRVVGFLDRGGIMVLVMGVAFAALGVLTVIASVVRLLRGERPQE